MLLNLNVHARAGEIDPKIACRAEDVITGLAGRPPDKLDFFGESKGKDSYHCEAYFSFNAYRDVWNRVNAMMPGLRKVEAACAANALLRLPKTDALQLQYDITAGGKYRITGAGDLPTDPAKLTRQLGSALRTLDAIRSADDTTLRQRFARKDCPLAQYDDLDD